MKYKSILILLSISLASIFSSIAQDKYSIKKAYISFFSSAPFEDIYAENNDIRSIIDLSSSQFALVIPISSFKFKKSLMHKHFNEKYLESGKYPNAIFIGKIISETEITKDSTNKIIAEGELIIHGISKQISIPAEISFKKNELYIVAKFILRPNDFDIRIPKIFIKNIAEEVDVRVKLTYIQTPITKD